MMLPRNWKRLAADLLGECDVAVSRHSRLRAKVLVFKSATALRQFWKRALGNPIPRARGAVNSLCRWTQTYVPHLKAFTKERIGDTDPRYFCVVGLSRGDLGMEVITHESAHAAFSYGQRVRRRPWPSEWTDGAEYDQEQICYPAGRIAAGIAQFLYKAGIIE